jgi:hypothetical protein
VKESNVERYTLAELRKMKDEGKLSPPGPGFREELPPGFWDDAKVVNYNKPKSVHLKLDADVFDFFKAQGKGHLTRMQNVLKAYVRAQTRR